MGVYIYQNGTEKELKNAYIGEYRVPGENTVAYYKFDGNLNDSSNNGYNLTGTDVTYNTLPSGIQVAYFNGTSSYAIKTGLNINLTEGTLNIWLKKGWNQSSETWGQLACDTGGWRISPSTSTEGNIGHLLFYNSWIFNGGNNTGISNGNRMNVVSVINSSGNTLYINGQQVSVTYKNGNASSKVSTMIWDTLVIGRHQSVSVDRTKGEASNWIVENKARTADEIANYYNSTKSDYGL